MSCSIPVQVRYHCIFLISEQLSEDPSLYQ